MENDQSKLMNMLKEVLTLLIILYLFFEGYKPTALVAFIIFIFLTLYCLKDKKSKQEQQESYLRDLKQSIKEAADSTLLSLPFPFILVNEQGDITWQNDLIKDLFNKDTVVGTKLKSLINKVDLEEIFRKKELVYQDTIISKKHYNIYLRTININSSNEKGGNGCERAILVYFHDISNVSELIATKESIMLIEVDNLDEVIKSTDNDKAPLLMAEIERTINNYALNLNAMIKKYESNKYIMSVQDRLLDTQISKKFDILDVIREINLGNKYDVTLSIGIGRGGISPLENYKNANKAKELALGRGGDQAVMKTNDKVAFFGGNTKEVEKRTRVRARVVAHALKDLVNESPKVYIMGHRNPDMDCIGAAVGVASAIKQLGKPCFIVLPEDQKAVEFFLKKLNAVSEEYKSLFISPEECIRDIKEDSLLIMVDVHSRGYVQSNDIAEKSKKIVILDHHRRSPDSIEGALLTYIEVYASSTSELVTEIIQYMFEKPKLKQIEAEGLLAGITMDTKNFYFKTGVRTFEAASFLRRLGADTVDIKRMFSDDLDSYIKRADIIRSAKVENNIAYALCPSNINEIVLAAQGADELLNITGIQASFVFVKIGDDINISGRSFGDINVQVILEALGGGGHMTIAGAKLSGVTMEEALNMLKEVVAKYLKEGEEK